MNCTAASAPSWRRTEEEPPKVLLRCCRTLSTRSHRQRTAECQRAHGDEPPQGAVPEQAAAESQGRALRESQI